MIGGMIAVLRAIVFTPLAVLRSLILMALFIGAVIASGYAASAIAAAFVTAPQAVERPGVRGWFDRAREAADILPPKTPEALLIEHLDQVFWNGIWMAVLAALALWLILAVGIRRWPHQLAVGFMASGVAAIIVALAEGLRLDGEWWPTVMAPPIVSLTLLGLRELAEWLGDIFDLPHVSGSRATDGQCDADDADFDIDLDLSG